MDHYFLRGLESNDLPRQAPLRFFPALREYGNVGQVAKLVVVIEPVADYEDVGNGETAVIGLERHGLPALLAKQHGDAERSRLQLADVADHLVQRSARV